MEVLWIYLLVINVAAFVMYGMDKKRAVRGQWRIPEKSLLLAAAVGGALGALLGMQIFRHKTRHLKFTVLVPLCLVLWAVLLCKIG